MMTTANVQQSPSLTLVYSCMALTYDDY